MTHAERQARRAYWEDRGVDDRGAYWQYCRRTAWAVRARSRSRGFPCNIDHYDIDKMLVDQGWRCAVSGVELTPPATRDPFSPSVDRITPSLGYVRGNVRMVCLMVNLAMNEWGAENFQKLVNAIKGSDSNSVLTPLAPKTKFLAQGDKPGGRVVR